MSLEILGKQRLYEEMKAGRSVMPLFRNLLNDYGTARIEVLTGAISAGLGLIASLQDRGVKLMIHSPSGGNKSSGSSKRELGAPGQLALEMTRAASSDLMLFVDQVKLVGSTLDATRNMFVWDQNRTAESKDNAPLKVEVVAMPTRETTTAIARDGSGNIKSSVAIERDKGL